MAPVYGSKVHFDACANAGLSAGGTIGEGDTLYFYRKMPLLKIVPSAIGRPKLIHTV
jgi:hypothetical protein